MYVPSTHLTPPPPYIRHDSLLPAVPPTEQRSPLNIITPQGTVPLAAHEAMVESIASDFSRREEALRAQLEQRDESSRKASSEIRGMSGSLARLKRDVASLRTALGRCVKAAATASSVHDALAYAREHAPPSRPYIHVFTFKSVRRATPYDRVHQIDTGGFPPSTLLPLVSF